MIDLMYITHLDRGKQKNLAYAFELAKSFSSPLSLLPVFRLNDPDHGKLSIWTPSKNKVKKEKDGLLSAVTGTKKTTIKKSTPLFLLGKSNPSNRSNHKTYKVIKQVICSGFPLLVLPYDYPFKRIRKVLFTGNAPGLTDHPLKHQIAANFLPRAYQLSETKLMRIHWNNIGNIAESKSPALNFCLSNLNINIERYQIDLAVFPVQGRLLSSAFYDSFELRKLLQCSCPALLIPLSTETTIYEEEESTPFTAMQSI